MRLSDEQYDDLANQAADYADAGVSTVSIDLGVDKFYVTCETETEGYCEDDYFNGTGGWITENACCRVTDYDQTVYVDEETEEPIDFDIDKFEQMVEKILIT